MTDGLRRELGRWGFSDTEIDIYLAVLEMGEGPASEVSDLAGVSARHVYRICERLEERGLVDVDEHVQPSRVRARPPTVVEDLIDQSCGTMVDGIESAYAASEEEPTDIDVLKRQPTVLARVAEMIADAEEWLILVAPPDVVEDVEEELVAAVDRDVLVLLVTTIEALSIDRPIDSLATVIRTRDSPMGFQDVGIGVDKIRSLLVSPSARLGDGNRYSPALYLDDETIGVRTNDALMGIEWRLGEEHLVPDPVDLPHSTPFFRETVLHAALHRREGTDLRATIDGIDLATGYDTSLDGTVTEVRQGIVEPYNQSFIGERTLVIDTDDETVTVGGPPATIEDFAADAVRLYSGGQQSVNPAERSREHSE